MGLRFKVYGFASRFWVSRFMACETHRLHHATEEVEARKPPRRRAHAGGCRRRVPKARARRRVGLRAQGSGHVVFRIRGLTAFGVWGLRFGVKGAGFRV